MKHFLICLTLLMCSLTYGQNITNNWQFESIKNSSNNQSVLISEADFLKLKDNTFEYQLAAKNNLKAKGDYIL